jgi:transglutaminase-like putative cysteine protease/sugar lactone lactonase YvrE
MIACLCVFALASAVAARGRKGRSPAARRSGATKITARPIGAVLGSIPSPGPCVTGLTWDGQHLWAADHKTDTLYKLGPKGAVLGRLPTPGYRPAGLAWDGRHLWNVDPLAQKLYRVDVKREVVDRTVDAPVPEARALGWDGKHLWLASARKGRMHRIDRGDGTTVDSHRTPSASVEGLAFDGRYLWVTDRVADRLHVVDPEGGEVLFSVKAPGPHVTGVAFDGKDLWVADYQTDRIYRLEHRGDGKPVRRAKKRQRVLLTHQLRNLGPGKVVEADVYIAVPRDNLSQQLRGVRFKPAPTEMLTDQWGQKVARFRFTNLEAGRFATVTMAAGARLFDVRHQVYPHLVRGVVPARERRYLADGSKYLKNDPAIRKAVKQAVGKERSPYWIARRIYRHVHQRMFYKLSGGWNVAPRVLQRGNGSCSEYSFVFISMCRAAGIPARYVGSLVVRKDDASFDDVFHRWVEIYLPGYGWLPVDPSRGDKKSEVKRSDAFGHLEPVFLITTQGGGGSTYLDWQYNANERWACKGRCEVQVESIAEWSPVK